MIKLPSLFDSFDNLDQIAPEDIARWLKVQPQLTYLENFLAMRILYPQTLPTTKAEMEIDLAILREALRLPAFGDNPFLNITLRKILIPNKMLEGVPDLSTLTLAVVDGLVFGHKKKDFFEDLWTIELTGQIYETVGSLLIPEFKDKKGFLQLNVLGKSFKIHWGTVTYIPCPKQRCEIECKLTLGKILGKEDLALEVYGGKLGLMIDTRS